MPAFLFRPKRILSLRLLDFTHPILRRRLTACIHRIYQDAASSASSFRQLQSLSHTTHPPRLPCHNCIPSAFCHALAIRSRTHRGLEPFSATASGRVHHTRTVRTADSSSLSPTRRAQQDLIRIHYHASSGSTVGLQQVVVK